MKAAIKWITVAIRGRLRRIPVTFKTTVERMPDYGPRGATLVTTKALSRANAKIGKSVASVEGKIAKIEDTRVIEAARGQGVGRRMFGELIDAIKKYTKAEDVHGWIQHPAQLRVRLKRFPDTELRRYDITMRSTKIDRLDAHQRLKMNETIHALSKIKRKK